MCTFELEIDANLCYERTKLPMAGHKMWYEMCRAAFTRPRQWLSVRLSPRICALLHCDRATRLDLYDVDYGVG